MGVIYGEKLADVYDRWFGNYEESAIETLADLANGGHVLELGIGTGRIAIPLAERGVEVYGIDNSSPMISKLRAKDESRTIHVSLGDFADVAIEHEFNLIFVVFNTFYSLLKQEDQVRCFHNVASHLVEGGYFLVEGFVPDISRFQKGQSVRVYSMANDYVSLQFSRHDPIGQRIESQHLLLMNNEATLYPAHVRYVWPSELDLMAQLAGLKLRNRWSSWDRCEFNALSENHVSLYEKSIS